MDNNKTKMEKNSNVSRPEFPKRAVITAGMPYGNKELHFGHIGGVFVQADTFARFLRDRIGKDNVIFVSGTDCYGSPIVEHYRKLVESGKFNDTIEDFVKKNHNKQKETLNKYHIDINLFAASSFEKASEVHKEFSNYVINTLYENEHLVKVTTSQFYDGELEVFLNGRQVVGQCPIDGCSSDKGYADECSLGHQYMPSELLNPKSTLTGKKPEMKDVTNWYLNLEAFHGLLKEWVESLKKDENSRKFVIKSIEEFLEPPVIYVKKDQLELLEEIKNNLPKYMVRDEMKKSSAALVFETLKDREEACIKLTNNSVRYRTGKTLVPFRLTGNIKWGVKAPDLEDLKNLTIWVWPESLWAPISFTKTYLESKCSNNIDGWKNWWCSKESKVFQFIGEDNIYFYGPVEMSMFMGLQGKNPTSDIKEGELQLPWLVPNNHILFFNKKVSSSVGEPPMADDLLEYYTAEQLRGHFLGLGLGIRSVGFQPKPLNPKAGEKDGDPVLKEGNLLANVFNRAIRSCFYTVQQYYNGKIPVGKISEDILNEAKEIIFEYEKLMYKCEFHQVMNLMDVYIRNINKYWSKNMKEAEKNSNLDLRLKALVDTFHMVKTAAVLMHPIAPKGTEMLCDYLNFNDSLWNWENIFNSIYDFMDNPEEHTIKFLEPRVDFFEKHPSQLKRD